MNDLPLCVSEQNHLHTDWMAARVRDEQERLFHDADALKKGLTCRCCGQRVQSYYRKITGVWAATLIHLYLLDAGAGDDPMDRWFHANDLRPDGVRGGDYAKLRFWGFIEQSQEQEHFDPKKQASGLWRITPLGRKFAQNALRSRRVAVVYNNEVLGYTGEEGSIRDFLDGSRFDYQRLMSGGV